MEDLRQDHLSQMDLQVDNVVRQQFFEAGKWAKFISIVMFVACGLILIFGILGGSVIYTALQRFGGKYEFVGGLNGAILIVVLVLIVALVALVYYFLYNFSRKIKRALLSDNTADLNEGLKSLKTFFIITTAFSILSLLSSIIQFFY